MCYLLSTVPSEDGALVKSVEFTYKMLIHLDFQGQQAFGSKQPFEIKHMALVFLYLPFFPSSPLFSFAAGGIGPLLGLCDSRQPLASDPTLPSPNPSFHYSPLPSPQRERAAASKRLTFQV